MSGGDDSTGAPGAPKPDGQDSDEPGVRGLRYIREARADVERLEAANKRLRDAAKRVLEADMLGVRDVDALNALEDAAGFRQQGDPPRNRGDLA